jgi:16S rRNA (cytosine967-C5)-methyltransferase
VQDPAAQLAARLCDPQPGERVLDACAGVGGKATHLAALAGGRAEIDALDRSAQKLALLEEHALRLRVGPIRARVCDIAAGLPKDLGPYDRALLDAPCSGLGTLRHHPEAKWERTEADLPALAALQGRLLTAVADRVRPGGRLVYAVCTLTAPEGPGVVDAFVRAHPAWHAAGPARIVQPQVDAADGFFLAVLERRP